MPQTDRTHRRKRKRGRLQPDDIERVSDFRHVARTVRAACRAACALRHLGQADDNEAYGKHFRIPDGIPDRDRGPLRIRTPRIRRNEHTVGRAGCDRHLRCVTARRREAPRISGFRRLKS